MSSKILLLAAAAVLAPATASWAQTAPASAPTTPASPPLPTPAPVPAPAPVPETPPKPAAESTAVEGVTVKADPNATRIEIDRRSYSIANDLQATTGSIADALRNVPSVEVDVQGNVSLRGNSGVTILVDGKPSGLFNGEGRADALQQMPADQIERVEVMTNPSAAYSPEGTAGIINLVTKKTRRQARSATVKATVGSGDRYNLGVSSSVMAGPLTLAGDAGFRHQSFESTADVERSRYDEDESEWFDSRQRFGSQGEGDSWHLRGSADYDPDAKTRLSAEVRFRGAEFSSLNSETYQGADATGLSAYDRSARGDFDNAGASATVRYRRQFAGEQHDLTADASIEHNTGDRLTRAVITEPAEPQVFEEIGGSTVRDQLRLSVDYNRPLPGDARLKAGAEFQFNDDEYDNFGARGDAPGSLAPVAALTNLFLYEQRIQAIYGTYQRPIGPVTAQFGLRFEAVQVDINQVTSAITDENSYLGVYPSLHVNYDLNDQQKLTASYSRRIQRPWAGDLNPYVVYVDPFNLRAGNPDLEPQITNSFELGWQYRKGPTNYLATLFYRQSSDGVTDVTRDLGDGVFLTTRENLAEDRSGGLELVASGRLNPKLTYNLTGEAFWNEIDASGLGVGDPRSDVSFFAFGTLSWQVTTKDFVQISGHVWGERQTAQGYMEPSGGLNLGWRHKFNDDISLIFTAQDVLGTFSWTEVIDTPLIRQRSEREFNARSVYIGLSWTFGSGPRRQRDPGFEFENGGGGPPG